MEPYPLPDRPVTTRPIQTGGILIRYPPPSFFSYPPVTGASLVRFAWNCRPLVDPLRRSGDRSAENMSFVPTKSSSPSVVTAALWLLLLLPLLLLLLLVLLRDGSCTPVVITPLLSSLLKKRVWTNVGKIVIFSAIVFPLFATSFFWFFPSLGRFANHHRTTSSLLAYERGVLVTEII